MQEGYTDIQVYTVHIYSTEQDMTSHYATFGTRMESTCIANLVNSPWGPPSEKWSDK